MGRLFTKTKRISGIKDPKLIIIASEGDKTEPEYFDELASPENYRNPRVHVEVLRRDQSGNSSPKHVIEQLSTYKRDCRLNKHDELWMVIDLDRWTREQLNEIAAECLANDYYLALSNPRFEVWLLLHFIDLSRVDEEECEDICYSKESLKQKIRECIGSFTAGGDIVMPVFMPRVMRAVEHARRIDRQPETRWPEKIGSRVYLLVESVTKP
jgi:hypothetical protein